MMHVLLEDMLFEVLPLIERVGLGGNIKDVCKHWFLDSWKIVHERSEFELHSLKCSLGVDEVCVCPYDAKQIQSTTRCFWN